MTDRRHGRVVLEGGHPDRPGADGPGERLDACLVVVRPADHPGPIDEQVRVGRRIAARVAAGHRVAADERDAPLRGALDDPALRAGDIGDERARVEAAGQRSAEVVQQVEARQGRCGQDHELGAGDRIGRIRRNPVHGTLRHGGRRSTSGR